ncbi:hypothetical protein D3C85_536110 [compost metagenome]
MAEQEGLRALANYVGATVVGAGLGQTGGVPLQEVLGADGQLGIDGEGRRQLVARDEQLLGLGARGSRQLGQIQAGLAVAHRVHRIEQGLAPEYVVLAGLDAEQRLLAHFGAVEHEGVENLAGRPAVVALGIVAQVAAAEHVAIVGGERPDLEMLADHAAGGAIAVDERIGVGAGVVVGLVVPGSGADAEAHRVLVDHVQLGQQVDAIGDVGPGLAEVVVAVVAVRGTQHALVGALGPHAVVVLHGVVETGGPVFVAEIQFDGLHGGHRGEHDRGGEQAEAQRLRGRVVVVHLLTPLVFILVKR